MVAYERHPIRNVLRLAMKYFCHVVHVTKQHEVNFQDCVEDINGYERTLQMDGFFRRSTVVSVILKRYLAFGNPNRVFHGYLQ